MRQNPPANRLVLVIAAVLAAFFVWAALVRPLVRGESPAETLLLFASGVGAAGLIVWLVLGRIGRLQRHQRRALQEREPRARVFGSYALNGVAAFLARAIPQLGLGARPRGLLTSSPTGVIDPSGFRLVRGGARLVTAYRVPRDRIVGVATGGIQEGAFLYPTLVVVVSHGAERAAIPIPVTRDESPLRRETPDGLDRLVSDAARIWGVPVLGAAG
ncbi:hypothetical protein [Leucobacter chromiiresistens]|uniref:Uncharacterized protein n=1 Tax=Leucobacter chromiiresistens TaxID=1079994 RepID=A0A1H0YZC5_9MICO|nr:hypothetical protein [Leucobacter chromiiresistens]SDQ20562.1 hypothetical protein SAMN04488565_1320 [Leucobacter chromiiresistens]